MKDQAKSLVKRFLRLPADAVVASSKRLPQKIQRMLDEDISIVGRFSPYQPQETYYAITQGGGQALQHDECGLPIPPQELWLSYGQTAAQYLDMGQRHVQTMGRIVAASGSSLGDAGRILDFGCAAGRMIRWLADLADRCELWGCDISARHVLWCQQHLSPPCRFVTTTTVPHLPFEDGYFGFVYAGSVFTNMSELADAWLLELRRVLRPGGRLYATVHDAHTRQLFLTKYKDTDLGRMLQTHFQGHELSESDLGMFAIFRTPGMTQVFHDISYIRKVWGRYYDILSVTEEAYGPQTAVLMQKAL